MNQNVAQMNMKKMIELKIINSLYITF